MPILALGIFAFAQRHEKLIYEAKASASEKINNKIANLSEALKSIEKDAIGDKQEPKSLASSNQTDTVRGQVKPFINPFLFKTPEIKLPEPNKMVFSARDITAILNIPSTPASYSMDFMKNGRFLTEYAKEEDIKVVQKGKELIKGEDYEFMYEKGIITEVRFKEHIQSGSVGVSIHIKAVNVPPLPHRKSDAIPLPSMFYQRGSGNRNSTWRYDNLGVSPKKMSFAVDTLRTFMPANFLGKEPLVIINGREYHPRILQSLNYREGRSYVAKPNDLNAIEKYGIKAQDGVVDIKTSSSFEFASEKERQLALKNAQRELLAYELYKNNKIVKVRLLENEGKEYERRIIRGFKDDRTVTIDLPLDGVIAYRIDGKQVSETEVINYQIPFLSSAYSVNDYYARIDLVTKK